MPVYKDDKRGTWYCCFYHTDWQGARQKKLKRGFSKQREAKEWERNFLDKLQGNPNMKFGSLVSLYIEDKKNRLRQSTLLNKEYLIDSKVLPYFKEMTIDSIKPSAIRQWQNALISMGYSDTYLKTINNQLCAIFNYAVQYYGLRENPCHKAGSMGKKSAGEMMFWTREEYLKFEDALRDNPRAHLMFQILYWCGIREGELFALTIGDFDLEGKTLSINKSLQRLKGEDVITEPKTPKSKRIVALPDFLIAEIAAYLPMLYSPQNDTRLFVISKHGISSEMIRGCKASGVKRIRIHDLRHSHASLLIELGYSPLLIAERLGHENIETTLNTYSHLFPHKQLELARELDKLGQTASYQHHEE